MKQIYLKVIYRDKRLRNWSVCRTSILTPWFIPLLILELMESTYVFDGIKLLKNQSMYKNYPKKINDKIRNCRTFILTSWCYATVDIQYMGKMPKIGMQHSGLDYPQFSSAVETTECSLQDDINGLTLKLKCFKVHFGRTYKYGMKIKPESV